MILLQVFLYTYTWAADIQLTISQIHKALTWVEKCSVIFVVNHISVSVFIGFIGLNNIIIKLIKTNQTPTTCRYSSISI